MKIEYSHDYFIDHTLHKYCGLAMELQRTFEAPHGDDLDTEARDYPPHMYGAVNYAVIDEVRKLPLKVSDIYRRLTT